MADNVANKTTSLSSEETIIRAVQFFSTNNWKTTSQSPRAVTFEGRVPIPWIHLLATIIGVICCIVPGIILYIMLIKKVRKFQNLVITATTTGNSTGVSITHPPHARKIVTNFLEALPAP